MKKIITLSLLLVSILTFAQVPQGISYQAIALNNSGNPVVSSNVGIRLSILDNSASGTVLYTETHTKTTNAQGLFNLVIGQGTATVGTFASIKWETNAKFLKEEIDVTGGTNYVLVGTTQLLSVPYAMYAGKVNSEDVVGGPDLFGYSSSWYSSAFISNSNAYVFAPNELIFDSSLPPSLNEWHSTPISGIPLKKSKNSFLTTTNAYIFGPVSSSQTGDHTNSWHSFSISGQPIDIVNIEGYFSTLVVTSSNAYAYTSDSLGVLNWYPTTISGTLVDISKGLGILTSSNAYIFSNNSWQSISITGVPKKIVNTSQGLLVLTSTNAYLYGTDYTSLTGGSTMSWHNIPISGTLILD